MDIIFTGRRTDVPERFRRYAEAKLGKLERLDRKAIRVDVEVSAERNPRQADRRQRVELTVASRGPVIRAEAAADDRYAALDRACAKLEERLRRSGDRRKARYGAPGTERVPEPRIAAEGNGQARPGAAAAPGPAAAQAAEEAQAAEARWEMLALAGAGLGGDGIVPIAMEGDGPLVVREKFHAATPMSIDQALLQMELVGHDFFLFRDAERGHPSVVYRRHGYQYGVIRLVEGEARSGPIQPGARAGLGSDGRPGSAAAAPGAGPPGPAGRGR
jgi:ribosomal subunit interface protein